MNLIWLIQADSMALTVFVTHKIYLENFSLSRIKWNYLKIHLFKTGNVV